MNQENDFIEREVKKIILFLKRLLSKISGATSETEKSVIKDLDVELREKLTISFFDFLALEKQALKSKVEEIDVLI